MYMFPACCFSQSTYALYMCIFPASSFRQRTYVAQGLLNGIHNETWTQFCLQFECFPVGLGGFYIEALLFFFFECVYFSVLYPALIYDMFIVARACGLLYYIYPTQTKLGYIPLLVLNIFSKSFSLPTMPSSSFFFCCRHWLCLTRHRLVLSCRLLWRPHNVWSSSC